MAARAFGRNDGIPDPKKPKVDATAVEVTAIVVELIVDGKPVRLSSTAMTTLCVAAQTAAKFDRPMEPQDLRDQTANDLARQPEPKKD